MELFGTKHVDGILAVPKLQVYLDKVIRPMQPVLEQIDKYNLFPMNVRNKTDGLLLVRYPTAQEFATMPKNVQILVATIVNGQATISDIISVICMVRLANDGVKVYRPSALDCEALHQVEPHFPSNEYRQPFDTMVIELPDDYQQSQTVSGVSLIDRSEVDNRPVAVIVHYLVQQTMMFSVVLQNGHAITGRIDLHLPKLLSAILDGPSEEYSRPGDMNDDEIALLERMYRLTINSMTLLTHYGCHNKGSTNQKLKERLLRCIAKNNKLRQDNRRALKLIPEIYTFTQNVTLYETESVPHGPGDGTGVPVSPHWRRGHYAQQPCGPNHSERKRIFRKPVFVRADLFMGKSRDTTVTYE